MTHDPDLQSSQKPVDALIARLMEDVQNARNHIFSSPAIIDTLAIQASAQINTVLSAIAIDAARDAKNALISLPEGLIEDLRQGVLSSMKSFYDLALEIQRAESALRLAEGEASVILKKYKWFFTPSMTNDLIFEVVEAGSKSGNQRGSVNKIFINYYTSNNHYQLRDIIESWDSNKIFKRRIKIIKDCFHVFANARGLYNPSNVVIPTLISQIDGILTDYINSSKRGTYFKNVLKDKTKDEYLPELFHTVLVDKLFQYSDSGKPLKNPYTFSRHKVLHGESTTYGRKDNAIRAFLILDFLANLG